MVANTSAPYVLIVCEMKSCPTVAAALSVRMLLAAAGCAVTKASAGTSCPALTSPARLKQAEKMVVYRTWLWIDIWKPWAARCTVCASASNC